MTINKLSTIQGFNTPARIGGATITTAPTGNYTSGGVTYDFWTFTGNSSLSVVTGGYVDVLLQGAGGGGSSETSGENGTTMLLTNLYVPASTVTITVGAGGTTSPTGGSPPFNGGNPGANSVFGSVVARGGTGGGFSRSPGSPANPGAVTTDINGSSTAYPNATYGNGGSTAPANGAPGVVIVRVARPVSVAAGGAVVSNTATGSYTSGSATYNYYTFTGNGSLNVQRAGFADVLVIGGGGGGGNGQGGGGGAGGYLSTSDVYLPAGSLTVTVGGGGTGGGFQNGYYTQGTDGAASQVGSIYYAEAGGAGGTRMDRWNTQEIYSGPGSSGGSGGGASSFGNGATFSGGTGTSGLGNNGGTAIGGGSFGGAGGGGGGGAVGANGASTTVGGAGGAGLASSITGSSVTRAGGGGGHGPTTGGAGGTGGGGAGAGGSASGTAGSANTGGGGGGANNSSGTGGNGGSGVVIVRVRTA